MVPARPTVFIRSENNRVRYLPIFHSLRELIFELSHLELCRALFLNLAKALLLVMEAKAQRHEDLRVIYEKSSLIGIHLIFITSKHKYNK